MKWVLKRIHFNSDYTVGELRVDNGPRVCYTLEDAVREVHGKPVSDWKIQGKTAIPIGVYSVINSSSPRFECDLPLLENVKGFSGIRIHPGNKSEDTEGCILPGLTWGGGDFIGSSRVAFNAVYTRMLSAWARGESVTLEVI